jgi:hypothetical protein
MLMIGAAHPASSSNRLGRLSSRLCEQHAAKSVSRFFAVTVAIWGGGSLLALRLWNRDLWEDALPPYSARYFWLGLGAVLVCEALAAGLLMSGSKTLLRSRGALSLFHSPSTSPLGPTRRPSACGLGRNVMG